MLRIIVALAGFAVSAVACGNKIEADPAPPTPTSIPTGAVSSEVPTVVLRAVPVPPRPGAIPAVASVPVVASVPLPSASVSSATSAAASSAP